MSTFNFIIPANFTINQNATLYIMDVPTSINNAKYHWNINCGSSLNTMFNNRNYTQVNGNNDAYTANLTINTTQLDLWLTTTGLNYDSNGSAGLTAYGLETGAQNFNLRLLEMAALEIFGHAKARAAISNDTAFNSLHSQLTTHLSGAFNDQNTRNIFFEQYVDINRYSTTNTSDINETLVSFNLANTSFYIFGFLNGNIEDATPSNLGIFSKNNYSADMRIQFYSGT